MTSSAAGATGRRALPAALTDRRALGWARSAVGLVVPYTLVQLRTKRRNRRRYAEWRRELAAVRARAHDEYDHQAAIDFLVQQRGLDELEVREGSMPLPSLRFVERLAGAHLPEDRPLVGLHVGNFVGVSLAYFSWLLRRRHRGSVVVSIDPNITHRGVEDPQSHVWALLAHFGLLDANLVVTAYSLEQSLGDVPEGGPDLLAERRGEHALRNLAITAPGRVDLAVIDGYHDGEYLERELRELRRLLAPGALVVVDDVETTWPGVVATFERVAGAGSDFAEVGRDGRVGVLRLST